MSSSAATAGGRRRRGDSAARGQVRRGTWLHRKYVSRYPLGTKLLVSALLLLVPLAFFAGHFVLVQIATLRAAEAEQSGIRLFLGLDRFVRDLAEHAESLGRSPPAGSPVEDAAKSSLQRAATDLQTLVTQDRDWGNRDTHAAIAGLRHQFEELGAKEPAQGLAGLAQHDALIKAALGLEAKIAADWGLLQDRDRGLNALLDAVLIEMPPLSGALAEIRLRFVVDAATPGDLMNKFRIGHLAAFAQDHAERAMGRLETALEIDGIHADVAQRIRLALSYDSALRDWLTHVSEEAMVSQSGPNPLIATAHHAEEMQQSLQQAYDALSGEAVRLIADRALQERRGMWIAFVICGMTVGMGAFLMHAVSSRTAGAVRRLVSISTRIAEGHYDHVIDERGDDEVSRLFAGFAEMQRRLSLQIGTERSQLLINTRIRSALDNVSGNVIVAAASGSIVHVNRSAQSMFQEAEPDIRATVPQFSAGELHGTSLDELCSTLVGEPLGLIEISETLVREFKAGARTFRIVANPVLSDGGDRFGVVVEWTDRTTEVAIENELQTVLRSVVNGELDTRMVVAGKAAFFATMGHCVNQLAENTATLVVRIKGAAGEILRGAQELSQGNGHLAKRTDTQTASLQRTAGLMASMTQTAELNAEHAGQADRLANAAREEAERGGKVVGEAIEAMEAIDESSRRIAAITGVIDEIAFQTNLLALNAAVEAARAGEEGRGFAVVANEVRNLAGRSAAAAKEIKALIEDSISKVAAGSTLVVQSGSALQQIVSSSKKVSDIVAQIAAASLEQTGGIGQVNGAMGEIGAVTRQNAGLVEEAAAAADSMAQRAWELNDLMAAYRIGSQDDKDTLRAA